MIYLIAFLSIYLIKQHNRGVLEYKTNGLEYSNTNTVGSA